MDNLSKAECMITVLRDRFLAHTVSLTLLRNRSNARNHALKL